MRRWNIGQEAKKRKGKTYDEIYGKDKANIIKKRLSKNNPSKKNMGKTYIEMYGQKKSESIKNKISKKIIERQTGKTWEELWGKKTAERVKEGLRKSRLGISPMEGKKHSEKTKKMLSKIRKGENNSQWLGGKSYEGYVWNFKQISKSVRVRDQFTCQLCGDIILKQTKTKFLTAHHIDYDKFNNSLSNLITLCNFCNSSVNFSREQWTEYFEDHMEVLKNA